MSSKKLAGVTSGLRKHSATRMPPTSSTGPHRFSRGTTRSLEKLASKHSDAFLLTSSFPQLLPPQAPSFPSFFELVEQDREQKPEARPQGLFQSLLADPQVLFQDVLDDPERYAPEVLEVLLGLMTGRKKLSELSAQELMLLDQATFEYAQASKKVPQSLSEPLPKKPELPPVESDDEKDIEYVEQTTMTKPPTAEQIMQEPDKLFDKAPSFWWRK